MIRFGIFGRIGILETVLLTKVCIDIDTITATSLYNGTLSSGSTTFNYGNYNFYVIIGKPASSVSSMSIVIPKAVLTTSTVKYQFADEAYYITFGLSYSGSTVTLIWSSSNGSGVINKVYGIN